MFGKNAWENFMQRKTNDHLLITMVMRHGFCHVFYGRLVGNYIKSNGNPIIFLAHAMEIQWLDLV